MAPLEGTVAERLTLVDAVDHLLDRGVLLHGAATISLAGVDLIYLGLNVLLASVETLEGRAGAPQTAQEAVWGARAEAPPRQPDGGVPPAQLGPTRPPAPRALGGERPDEPASRAPGDRPAPALPGERRATAEQPAGRTADPARLGGLSGGPSALAPLTGQASGAGEDRPAAERPEHGLARLVLALLELLRQLLERQALRRLEGARLTDDEIERMGLALQALEEKMAELLAAFDLEPDDVNLDLGPLGRLVS